MLELILSVRDDANLGPVVDAVWSGLTVTGWLGFITPDTAGFFRIGVETPQGTQVLDHAIAGPWRGFILAADGTELANAILTVPA